MKKRFIIEIESVKDYIVDDLNNDLVVYHPYDDSLKFNAIREIKKKKRKGYVPFRGTGFNPLTRSDIKLIKKQVRRINK